MPPPPRSLAQEGNPLQQEVKQIRRERDWLPVSQSHSRPQLREHSRLTGSGTFNQQVQKKRILSTGLEENEDRTVLLASMSEHPPVF